KKATVASLAMLCLNIGCTDSFDEVNTDPDRTEEVPISNILAYVIRNTADNLFDEWCDMNEPSTYAGYLSRIQYIDESRYEFRTETIENKWYYIYLTYNNAKTIEKRAAAEGAVNMESVAKVWGTLLMAIGTDTWRDMPYSEACKMDEGILLPKYDTQETIYPGMLTVLSSAAEGFASGATDKLGVGDILFDGDVAKWQKFCNSLRLRLAMRIAKVDPTLAKSTVEQILGNPSKYPTLTANEDNAFFIWPGESPYIEPWADNSRARDDHGVSDVLVNLLQSLDDPRLPVYAHPAKADGKFRGGVIGAKDVVPEIGTISRIGARFRDNFKGFTPFLRAAETYFNMAEASKLGWTTGTTTKEAYETAVTLSLKENEIAEADITAYLAGKAKFNDSLDQIYEQEWLALFKQGMEGWSLYRKTGIPKSNYIAPGTTIVGHNTPPFRQPYPINESNLNGANVEPYVAQIEDDFWGKQMWWDTRTGVN
ncbi:MAG: SusD/RagB family nutrient-binding outer membrane lipoprotein, partial [Tannerellaceae bacterium]